MEPGYRVLPVKPTGAQLKSLREAVGWSKRDTEDIQKGLDGSLFAVCAYFGEELVGSARVVGDGRSVFYIQDVIVRPSHQGKGVGNAMMALVMEYIAGAACEGAVVGLMAARGREPFYERFGFHVRPNEREGAGMIQFWKTGPKTADENEVNPMGREFSHRMAAKTLAIRNPDGTPAAGKALKITQTRHSFLFGCGAFDALEIAQTADPAKREILLERMEKWLALFNYGTLPFYWGRYEPAEGRDIGEAMMKAALWLGERGVVLKGHPLCWHTVCADWLMQYPNGVILEKQLARIRRDVGKFRGVIDLWDVVNEAVIMPVFGKYDNAVTRICKELGRVELIRRTFAAAREAGPSATLLLNDFNTSAEFALLLEECLDAGIPIGAIGIQSHQHQGYWGLKKLREVLSRFAHYGLPIHFTENTLISGNLMPRKYDDLNDYKVSEWPSTPEGEDRQAREIAEMYAELFRHPLVEAVTAWDFTDGKWLGAPSGLLRRDNSCKPAYLALMEKIKRDWWTDEEVVTDENGEARFSGFMGDYEVTGPAGKGTFTLEREGFKTVVALGDGAG